MCKQGKIICIFEGGVLKITEDGVEDATMQLWAEGLGWWVCELEAYCQIREYQIERLSPKFTAVEYWLVKVLDVNLVVRQITLTEVIDENHGFKVNGP